MKMVTLMTAELVKPALDWAVAMAVHGPERVTKSGDRWRVRGPDADGDIVLLGNIWPIGLDAHLIYGSLYQPSEDWAQGGPLRDKYRIALWQYGNGVAAHHPRTQANMVSHPTALVALCRAIVAAAYGAEMTVPAELVQGGGA